MSYEDTVIISKYKSGIFQYIQTNYLNLNVIFVLCFKKNFDLSLGSKYCKSFFSTTDFFYSIPKILSI